MINGYKLRMKDYKDEWYEKELSEGLTASVGLWYHTTHKYWSVGIRFDYPLHYRTPYVAGEDYVHSRKEARKLAVSLMKEDPQKYYNMLDDFQKEKIVEATTKR